MGARVSVSVDRLRARVRALGPACYLGGQVVEGEVEVLALQRGEHRTDAGDDLRVCHAHLVQ